MKPNTRFVKSVVETARKCDADLPWARGARRAAMIARRDRPTAPVRSARTA